MEVATVLRNSELPSTSGSLPNTSGSLPSTSGSLPTGHVRGDSEDTSVSDTTQSVEKTVEIRLRLTDRRIYLCQFSDPSIINSDTGEPYAITDVSTIAQLDHYLKCFLKLYKENYNSVKWALAGQYFYDPSSRLFRGVLVTGTDDISNQGSLQSHQLTEKLKPTDPSPFGKYQNTLISDGYPIHTKDVVCKGGNSLRPLLTNWINDDFYDCTHWVIAPYTIKDPNQEFMKQLLTLLKAMKEEVLKFPRTRLNEDEPRVDNLTPVKKKQKRNQQGASYQDIEIKSGKTYEVTADQWVIDEARGTTTPKKEDGNHDQETLRWAKHIESKGGKVDPVVRKLYP